jgi:predicted Fe-Mo cluster-binding NifX family protein
LWPLSQGLEVKANVTLENGKPEFEIKLRRTRVGGIFNMKIAIVTEDGATISQHFGRAPYYMVVTAENGKIVGREKRNKAAHHTAGGGSCHEDHSCHDGKHGMEAASQAKHAGMLANILDSQVLIAGGMGYGAYESLESSGIEPIITDVESIDEAVKLHLEGKLVNLMEKLH